MKKELISKLLVENGFAGSEAKAQALVMAGVVLVDEKRVEKSSERFSREGVIRIKGQNAASKFVGRGGLKLEGALESFNIRPNKYVCLDIGSSTGGFTDCLLQSGAERVYAVDAGTNQLAWKLRNDPRVVVRENVNARYLKADDFDELFDLIVMDVSFISVTKILGALMPLLKPSGKIITLIKPQFELPKSDVGKGGVVTDPEKHRETVAKINNFAGQIGMEVSGLIESPVLGGSGNKEFLALYERN
ncbi:MAG: TlyA family RNA methyltransferase [Pyrinomonadaceae bacterium]